MISMDCGSDMPPKCQWANGSGHWSAVVNCHLTRTISISCVNTCLGTSGYESVSCSVKIKDREFRIDFLILFQWIWIIKESDDDLKNFLKYKIARSRCLSSQRKVCTRTESQWCICCMRYSLLYKNQQIRCRNEWWWGANRENRPFNLCGRITRIIFKDTLRAVP